MTVKTENVRKPRPYWCTATFRTREGMDAWIQKYGHLAQWQEVFIENGYAIEHKALKRF